MLSSHFLCRSDKSHARRTAGKSDDLPGNTGFHFDCFLYEVYEYKPDQAECHADHFAPVQRFMVKEIADKE